MRRAPQAGAGTADNLRRGRARAVEMNETDIDVLGPDDRGRAAALARIASAGFSDQEGAERFRQVVEQIPRVAVYIDVVIPDDPGHSIPVYISPQIEDMMGYPL